MGPEEGRERESFYIHVPSPAGLIHVEGTTLLVCMIMYYLCRSSTRKGEKRLLLRELRSKAAGDIYTGMLAPDAKHMHAYMRCASALEDQTAVHVIM